MNYYQQEESIQSITDTHILKSESKAEKYGLQLLNLLLLLVTIGFNTAAVLLPINGKTTQQLADSNPNLFVPAGFTFSIWSIIYTLQLVSHISILVKIYQGKEQYARISRKIGFAFIVTCILNSLWILSWHYEEFLLSLLWMFSLLSTLIYTYHIITEDKKSKYLWDVNPQYSIYLAWICVAAIANVATVLVHYYWDGLGLTSFFWSVVMMSVATCIGIFFLLKNYDLLFAGTIAWALFGISKKENIPVNHFNETTQIAFYLFAGILSLIIIRLFITAIKRLIKSF